MVVELAEDSHTFSDTGKSLVNNLLITAEVGWEAK